jgi:hypothetical protein
MTGQTRKDKLLSRSETGYASIKELLSHMSEAQITRPDAIGDWSIKNFLIHLTAWQWKLLDWLDTLARGASPTLPLNTRSVLESNDDFIADFGQRPLQQVLDDFDSTHRKTMQAIEALSEDELNRAYDWAAGQALWKVIAACAYHHYSEHARQFQAYLGQPA